MKVKIQVAVTKKTARRGKKIWHEDFSNRIREGESRYDYLDFGPMDLERHAISELGELIDFIRGPSVVSVTLVDVEPESRTIEKIGD